MMKQEYLSAIANRIAQNKQEMPMLARRHDISIQHLENLQFTASGALTWNNKKNSHSQEFLETNRLTEKRGSRVLSRGPIFFESLDPFLESSDLLNNIEKTLIELQRKEPLSFEERYVYLDYIKSSNLQIFNAIIGLTRKNISLDSFGFNNPEKNKLTERYKECVALFYDFLLFEEFDWKKTKTVLENFIQFLKERKDVLAKLPRENIKLSESTHPLRMLSTAALIIEDNLDADHIIGIPSGGTESAFILQYLYLKKGHLQKNLTLTPSASFHSKIDLTNIESKISLELSSVQPNEKVIIIDDNTATGITLRTVAAEVEKKGVNSIKAYCIEADTQRMKKVESLENLPNLEFLKHATGVLPVKKKNHPNGAYQNGSNAINEIGRRVLAQSLREQAQQESDSAKIITLLTRAHLIEYPTSRLLREAKKNPKSILSFRYREFSNFHPVSVQWKGKSFPSIEHAYQFAKYEELADKPISDLLNLVDLQESDQKKLKPFLKLTFLEFMMNSKVTAGSIKMLAHTLPDTHISPFQRMICMAELSLQKYSQEPFQSILQNSGDGILIEGNTWQDTFWGIDQETKEGHNILGRLLMMIRDQQNKI